MVSYVKIIYFLLVICGEQPVKRKGHWIEAVQKLTKRLDLLLRPIDRFDFILLMQLNDVKSLVHVIRPRWPLVFEILECSWMFLNVLEFYLVLNCSWKSVFSTLGSSMFLNFSILWIFLYCMFYVSYTWYIERPLYLTLGIWIFYFCLRKPIFFSWNILELFLNFFLNLSGHPAGSIPNLNQVFVRLRVW